MKTEHINYINVAYAFYNKYYYITHVSMKSIMLNQFKNTFINFHILIHKNVYNESKPIIDKVCQEHKNCKIKYFIMGNEFREFQVAYFWTTGIFYRLLLQNLLINETKCLYFDCDTLIYKDLNEIYNYNITDKYYLGGYEGHPLIKYGKGLNDFINSGVLLINLKKLREDKIFDKIITFLREKNGTLIFPDQEAINVVCNKNNGIFPRHFISSGVCDLDKIKQINYEKIYANMTKHFIKPYIFHFRIYKKPWFGISEGKNKFICFDFLSRFYEQARRSS